MPVAPVESAGLSTRHEIEDAPPPALSLRQLAPLWPLALVLLATIVAYAPSLTSPLFADDYIYLVSARDWSFGEYTRVAFTPWGDEPTFTFTRDYWRPLAVMWFEFTQPVFGDNPLPYHLVNLAIHMTSAVLVWVLAGRLDARPAVRAVATLVFALYPGSYDAVTWISSVNSAGLPFALAAWLVFLRATRGESFQWSWTVLSAGLVAIGLMFRESSVALLPAMGLWYFLMQRRQKLVEWRTYLPLVPFIAVGVAYALIRTRLLTEPFANSDIYKFDDHTADRWWFYIKHALLPFRVGAAGWKEPALQFAGIVLLAIPLLALARRRWDILALSAGLLLSIVPYGATVLGIGQRYFYFSVPVLALMLGVIAAEAVAFVRNRSESTWGGARPAWAGVAALLVLSFAGAAVTFDRIVNWNSAGPDQHEAWIDGLRAEYPEMPAGGTLYASNVPFILSLFDGVMIEPTVRWYYPEIGDVVYHTTLGPPALGPRDRWFDPVYGSATPAPR